MSSENEKSEKPPLDQVLDLLRIRMNKSAESAEIGDLCEIAKVFLAAEKAEAETIAKLLGNRGKGKVSDARLERILARLEAEPVNVPLDPDSDEAAEADGHN